MATRTEIKMNSIQKEIEKIQKSLDRYEGILEKKIAKCEKLNCNWTKDEWFVHRDANDFTADQDQAYFEKCVAEHDVEDTQRRLENRIKALAKATGEFEKESGISEANKALTEKCENLEAYWDKMKEEYEEWLKKFKEECLMDGIVIDNADANFVSGTTKNGKKFFTYRNNGFTLRSYKCYTLNIEGETIFTSGTFSRCYGEILRR